jgi:hypothetical protein
VVAAAPAAAAGAAGADPAAARGAPPTDAEATRMVRRATSSMPAVTSSRTELAISTARRAVSMPAFTRSAP